MIIHYFQNLVLEILLSIDFISCGKDSVSKFIRDLNFELFLAFYWLSQVAKQEFRYQHLSREFRY
jgi:hypothetical protein